MKPFKFLRRYYAFYTNIRFKLPQNTFSQWICVITRFLQYTSLSLYISNPLKVRQSSIGSDAISHIQCFFALIPWIFGTSTYLYDSFLFFFVNILSLLILEMGVRYTNKYKRSPNFFLIFIRIYQTYFCPVIEFPLFQRSLLIIQSVTTTKNSIKSLKIFSWLSFSISILNVLMLLIHTFFHSIFLAPIDFIPTSLLDIYDGKTNTILFIFCFLVNFCSYFVYIATDIMYIILISILMFIFCFILFYLRVMTSLHVSFVGAYFELSPFFCFPFEIILQFGYANHWYLNLSLLIFIHFLFILVLKIVNFFVKKEALKIFKVLIRRNEEEEEENELDTDHHLNSNETEFPSFASGNVVSGLRIMSMHYGDPRFATKFALIQHRSGVRASPMIEIVRFLGIFPSKRIEMLKELKSLKSSSNYNRFMIYFFSKVLRSLVKPCNEKNKSALNYYQKTFIVHNHLFWNARSQKKFIDSIIEACSVSYFYYEFKMEILNLISRFYFDVSLYRRFGDFLLIANGDYENSVFYQKFADQIENKEVKLTDTLIHRYIKFNPRILRFLNEDEFKSSSVNDVTLIQKKILNTKSSSFFNSTNKLNTNTNNSTKRVRKKSNLTSNSLKSTNESTNIEYSVNSTDMNYSNENTTANASPLTTANSYASVGEMNQTNETDAADEYIEKPVATYLHASNRWIPFFPIMNNIFASLLILIFLFRIIPMENKTIKSFAAIGQEKPQMIRIFVDAGNAIFFPFSLTYHQIAQNINHNINTANDIDTKNIIDNTLFNLSVSAQKKLNISEIFVNKKINHFLNKNNDFKLNEEFKKLHRNRLDEMNSNSSIECQVEFYLTLNNIINFFVDISQTRNLTELIVSHLSSSIRLLSEDNYSMCNVLQSFYSNMYEYPIIMMDNLENALKKLNSDFENVNNRINLIDFLSINLIVYFSLIIFFLLLYSTIMILQVNLAMKNEKMAISFFSSKERFECLLLQKAEKSWDALTLFMQPEMKQFLQLREYSDDVGDANSYELLFENSNKGQTFSIDSKSENSSLDEFEENYEAEKDHEANTNPFIPLNSPLLGNSTANTDALLNLSVSTSLNESENNNDNNTEKVFNDRNELNKIIDRTLKETKETTKFTWLLTFFFLLSPWILQIISILLLVYPIVNHSKIETGLAQSAMKEGHQLFACYELIKETSNYLYNNQKNVSKFIEIHKILNTVEVSSSFTASYFSTITEYYRREQCMQLLGITCTSISNLVLEIIKDESISEEQLTMLILPAFVLFGRSVLEDIFYQESEYLPKIQLLSEEAFFILIFIFAFVYLVNSYVTDYSGMIEGFNSLFHFPKLLLLDNEKIMESEMNRKVQNDFISHSSNVNDSNLNSMMWKIYRTENGEKLPSTIISISSLRKNGEIYSISENVEKLFNRSPTSFIGQQLNEIFPIVSSEFDDTELRQFFMPDLTRKLFQSSTVNKNEWVNLTLMIEDDRSHTKKSYKEDTVTEKLMNYVPTFFAKSFGLNGRQSFEFLSSVVVYMRFDSSLPSATLEQYFTVVNNAINNFTSIKAIVADGGLFVFSTIKPLNSIVPFLFVRDLIDESKFPKRGRPTNGTYSILIVSIDQITTQIFNDEVCEPFLQTNVLNHRFKSNEKILFGLKKEQICFDSNFEGIVPGITNNGENTRKSIKGVDYELTSFTFSQYLSNLKHLI